MTTPNSNLSERLAVLARIAPQSTSGTATSAYVGPGVLQGFGRLLVLAQSGANGTGTLTVSLVKAADGSGTGVTAVATATALASSAGTNQDILFDFAVEDLDPANPYMALQMTVSANSCLVSGVILGGDAWLEPASDDNAASVAQIL